MNKETNNSIAGIFKATRRFNRLQQTEFSAILGVTQGTISKIEAGAMGPDLGLWFKFLKAFNIQDPYCFTYFGVEFSEEAFKNLRTEGSALAPLFDFKKGNYVFNSRKIRPLFDFLIKNYTKNFETFLKENKINKEIFYILNHPISSDLADKFFAFLYDNKINAKSVMLLDLNFDHALGRQLKDLSTSGAEKIFSILNNENESFLEYEISDNKGEYFINLKKNSAPSSSDLILNYNLLFPYHVMKSTKSIKGSSPQIHEVKKDQRWQVTYA